MLTFQSISPTASAWVSSAVWIVSQVPSPLNRRCRFHTVCHGPNSAVRSRQAIPVRNRYTTPSTIVRWSRNLLPRLPSEDGINGSISSHWVSDSTAERDIGQPSHPEPPTFGRHALVGSAECKDATSGQIRISALTVAGIRTVQQV